MAAHYTKQNLVSRLLVRTPRLRGRVPGLGGGGAVGGRHRPTHGAEGQEPALTGNTGGGRGRRPNSEGDPTRQRRSRSSGLQVDWRGPGQPGARRGESRRPARRVHRTQRLHWDDVTDGGRGGAQRRGAASRPVEAERRGAPLHARRGGREGTEVADLTKTYHTADDLAEAAMTDNARPV